MKINILKIALPAFLLLLFSSCQKEILIKQQPYDSKLTIESLLMPGSIPKVYLSRSIPFFDSNVSPSTVFVNNAEVIISGGGEEEVLAVDSVFDDFFCRWQPFYNGMIPTRENTVYHLRVTYEGKTYEANTITDVQPVQLESVSYTQSFTDVYGQHQGVVIDFTDPAGANNYYRFHMTRDVDNTVQTIDDFEHNSWCIGGGETTIVDLGWFVYFDKNADGKATRLIMEPSHTFSEGDEALVRLQTLDKNAAEYFDHLDKLKQASLNPFIEPVFLRGQIDGAIGYFGSMNLSEPVIIVFPEKDND